MKKLMFYINTLGYGGAERVISNLANQFSAEKYDVTFVTSYPMEKEHPLSDNVTRVNLFVGRIEGTFRRNTALIWNLRKQIRRYRPDVLVAFMAEPNMRAIVASVGIRTVKTVVSVRNDPQREYPGFVSRIIAKVLYSFADGVVFQTKDAQSFFPVQIRKKSEIILNQVADEFFCVERSEDQKNIIAVGRLVAQKNFELLIRAYGSICNDVKENLIIYGEGPERQKLEALIQQLSLESRVSLPGVTEQIAGKLSDTRLFVLSSDYEGLPNALMEAMAGGVPCVATDCPCGGPRMLIEDGRNGFLVPVMDEVSLAEKMRLVLNCDDLMYEEISMQTKQSALRYSAETVFAAWKKYLSQIALR